MFKPFHDCCMLVGGYKFNFVQRQHFIEQRRLSKHFHLLAIITNNPDGIKGSLKSTLQTKVIRKTNLILRIKYLTTADIIVPLQALHKIARDQFRRYDAFERYLHQTLALLPFVHMS